MSRGDRKPMQIRPFPLLDAILHQRKAERLAALQTPGPGLAKVSAGAKKAPPTVRRQKRRAEKQARKRQRGR